MKTLASLALAGLIPAAFLVAGSDSQRVTLDHKLQIPGATLKSGEYTFEIEDRLQDRAIIRITDAKKNQHELLLAVPNEKLNQADRGKLILFPGENSDKQVLHGWMCPSCQTALEVVYPKNEAVKITGVSARPVMAVDPTYDKLPKNLSPDDMKVVTLWLLSPKEVTPDQKGKGLEAAKWADVNSSNKTEVAEVRPPAAPASVSEPEKPGAPAPAPAPAPTLAAPEAPTAPVAPTPAAAAPIAPEAPAAAPAPVAPAAVAPAAPVTPVETPSVVSTPSAAHRRMPHTASNTYTFGLAGFLFFFLGSGLWLHRKFAPAASKEK